MARVAVVTVAIARVLPVTVVGTVQSIQHKGICSYPAHLFIDKLAKVSYIEYTTPAIKMRIHQICSEAFKYRQRDLSLVYVHDTHLRIAF
jgi:hypothetical protein